MRIVLSLSLLSLCLCAVASGGESGGKWARFLPRTAAKLCSGQPYTVLAVGDSVTATGKYYEFLAEILAKESGNPQVKGLGAAHPGCSVDATVRNYDVDVAAHRPDLLLVMYGLNDQICHVPAATYVDNYLWLAKQAQADFGCDVLFLAPTPHLEPDEVAKDPGFAWRTASFGALLRGHGFPVVPMMEAFTSVAANDERELIERLWDFYPGDAVKGGDSIHPAEPGHRRMARIVADFLAGRLPPPPLAIEGEFVWPAAVRLTVTNRGTGKLRGRLVCHWPHPLSGEFTVPYELAPGERLVHQERLQGLDKPEQLLQAPWTWYVRRGQMSVSATDFRDGQAQVRAVACPWRSQDLAGNFNFPLRLEGECGRFPVVRGTVAREVFYLRHASAVPGAVTVDGQLDEWSGAVWSHVGAPCQARDNAGPADHRASPADKNVAFSFRDTGEGLAIALQVAGRCEKDSSTLFFDTRSPDQLGRTGRYCWLSFAFNPDGTLRLDAGETADRAAPVAARWAAAPNGATVEVYVSWAWLKAKGFPPAGEMGFSLWWHHDTCPDAERTSLHWSESGHPWTPHNYGRVTRQENPDAAALPYYVRVE